MGQFQVLHGRSDFYPRPPRGGRQRATNQSVCKNLISIHALREEGDAGMVAGALCIIRDFYPRPPRGGRRKHAKSAYPKFIISIHALREEGDPTPVPVPEEKKLISIHALREEGDSKNREKTPCFCLIIHLSAQIAKRCLQNKPQNHTVTCANGWYSGAKRPGKPCVLPVRTGRTSKD